MEIIRSLGWMNSIPTSSGISRTNINPRAWAFRSDAMKIPKCTQVSSEVSMMSEDWGKSCTSVRPWADDGVEGLRLNRGGQQPHAANR